jgi:hypothetical protein
MTAYEYETESCIDRRLVKLRHTIHCSEYEGFNDHCDGVGRKVREYGEQGNCHVVTLTVFMTPPCPTAPGTGCGCGPKMQAMGTPQACRIEVVPAPCGVQQGEEKAVN